MKKLLLVMVLAAIVGAIFYLDSQKPSRPTGGGSAIGKPYKEFVDIAGYLNLPAGENAITIGQFIGKDVVLIDFWTYSCINCERTLPYLTAWDKKYRGKGLQIIGVHTPEFDFEAKYQNVKKAVEGFGVEYPVVLDNDYATWRAYGNRYWPRKYLIDIYGKIVYDHIGEGAYKETERKIQELLAERAKALGETVAIGGDTVLPDAERIDATKPLSPEIYFGAARNAYLGNGVRAVSGRQTLSAPANVETNTLYLGGDWNIAGEFAENVSAGAKIIFRYRARRVNLVASSEEMIQIKVRRDGVLVREVPIKSAGLYRVIDDPAWGEHTLEILIPTSGLKAYTLTFG